MLIDRYRRVCHWLNLRNAMIDEEADDPVLQAKLKETKVKKAKSKRSRRAKAKKKKP